MSKSFQHPLLRRAAVRAGSVRAGGRRAALLGRSVSAAMRIQRPGTHYLGLAEVQVFGR